MPREIEVKLARRARKLRNQGRLKGTVEDYVYGTMEKIENRKAKRKHGK